MEPAEWLSTMVDSWQVRDADTGLLYEVGVVQHRWPASRRIDHYGVVFAGPIAIPGSGRRPDRSLLGADGKPAHFRSRRDAELGAAHWAWMRGGKHWPRIAVADAPRYQVGGTERFWMCACSLGLLLPPGWRRLDPSEPPPWAHSVVDVLEELGQERFWLQ